MVSTAERPLEILRACWKTDPEKPGQNIAQRLDLTASCLVRAKEKKLLEVVVSPI